MQEMKVVLKYYRSAWIRRGCQMEVVHPKKCLQNPKAVGLATSK